MKIRWTPGLVLLVLMVVAPAFSRLVAAELEWRVSIKVVLDKNGQRAKDVNFEDGNADLNEDSEIYGVFDLANRILDTYGRGYHFKVVEITNLHDLPPPPTNLMCCVGGDNDGFELDGTNGCPGGTTNTYNQWFFVPSFGAGKKLYEAATNEPARFAWRTDALNVYILGSPYSGTGGNIGGQPMMLGQQLTCATTPFHEMGHTFDLNHTHGGNGRQSDDPDLPGDDGICDTLLDNSSWNSNDITIFNFGLFHTLTDEEQRQVDETYNNLMSYHSVRELLTQGQLDVMTDTSNKKAWPGIVNGRSWFVDAFAGGCAAYTSTQSGTSSEPYHTVAGGLSAADSGDIVLIRPGYYNEPLTISQPVTLRTPRSSARIGSPR
jgi:hypothetical protein